MLWPYGRSHAFHNNCPWFIAKRGRTSVNKTGGLDLTVNDAGSMLLVENQVKLVQNNKKKPAPELLRLSRTSILNLVVALDIKLGA